jgi:hypothetical protein
VIVIDLVEFVTVVIPNLGVPKRAPAQVLKPHSNQLLKCQNEKTDTNENERKINTDIITLGLKIKPL